MKFNKVVERIQEENEGYIDSNVEIIAKEVVLY